MTIDEMYAKKAEWEKKALKANAMVMAIDEFIEEELQKEQQSECEQQETAADNTTTIY